MLGLIEIVNDWKTSGNKFAKLKRNVEALIA